MGFIMEFAENFIRERMPSHEELNQNFRDRVERKQKRQEKNKRVWSQPTLPYRFWNSLKFNREYLQRLEESNWKGKQDPYDVIKPDPFAGLERPKWDFKNSKWNSGAW